MFTRCTALLTLAMILATVAPLHARSDQPEPEQRPLPRVRAQARDTQAPKAGSAQIRGRIVSAETGAPVRRAQVRVFGDEMRKGRVTSTNGDGRYELRDLPSGRYTLTVSKEGFVSLAFGQRRPFEPGRPIELVDGQRFDKTDFSLPRGGVITGRVLDEYGEPISNVAVMAMRYRYVRGRRRMMPAARGDQTDDIGQFRIYGLSPGDYYVTATLQAGDFGDADDRSGYAPTYYPGTPAPAEAQRVTVSVGQETTNINFALMPVRVGRVSGVALDSAGRLLDAGFVTMRPEQPGPGRGLGASISRGGRFDVSNVPPGDYFIEVHARAKLEPEFAVMPITVTGQDLGGLTIVTSRGVTARGQIVFDGGTPAHLRPQNLRLFAAPGGSDPMMMGRPSTRVHDDWTFELKALYGPRLIRPEGRLPDGWSLKSVLLNGADVTDTPVDFKGHDAPGDFQVVLTRRTTEISGTVADSQGTPLKDYVIVVFAEDPGRWVGQTRFIQIGRPDQEGRFKISGLPPAQYLAVAVDYVETGEETDPEFLERMKTRATTVQILEGESKSIDLTLTP